MEPNWGGWCVKGGFKSPLWEGGWRVSLVPENVIGQKTVNRWNISYLKEPMVEKQQSC